MAHVRAALGAGIEQVTEFLEGSGVTTGQAAQEEECFLWLDKGKIDELDGGIA